MVDQGYGVTDSCLICRYCGLITHSFRIHEFIVGHRVPSCDWFDQCQAFYLLVVGEFQRNG